MQAESAPPADAIVAAASGAGAWTPLADLKVDFTGHGLSPLVLASSGSSSVAKQLLDDYSAPRGLKRIRPADADEGKAGEEPEAPAEKGGGGETKSKTKEKGVKRRPAAAVAKTNPGSATVKAELAAAPAPVASAKAKPAAAPAKSKPAAAPAAKAVAKAKMAAAPAPVAVAKAKPAAAPAAKAKTAVKLGHESTRQTYRVRFDDGTSKGFHYQKADPEDQEAKRLEARRHYDETNRAALGSE